MANKVSNANMANAQIASLGNTDLLLYSSDNPTSDRICKSNTPGTQLQEEDDDASIYSDTDRSITNSTGTVLIEAAEKGDVSKVREVLDKTVIDPDRRTRYQARSALHLACGYGQYPVVEELLLAGADPCQMSHAGRTPLHEACQGGHIQVMQLLMDYSRELDVPDRDGQTAAHLAAYNGEVKCLQSLADRGANLVCEDRQRRHPSHLAAVRNHRNVMEFLYDAGVDLECIDSSGRLPIHLAALHGALDCLICLVERDCDITLGDNDGNLPFHHAAAHNHVDCMRFLIKQGTPFKSTNKDHKTSTHLAAHHGSVQAVHWLMTKGICINALDVFGNTPAHYAAQAGKGKSFNCLLYHGADVNVKNQMGENVFETARRHGHPLLIEKAAKNEVSCPQCVSTKNYQKWKLGKRPPPVVENVGRLSSKAYTCPVPKTERSPTQLQLNAKKKVSQKLQEDAKPKLPQRDLTTKYFGEYLDDDLSNLKFNLLT